MPEFTQLLDSLKNDVKDAVFGHSEFQIRHFIIGSCPTPYGQYKQCVLELRSRIKNYENLNKIKEEVLSQNITESERASKISECEILMEDIKRETYILNDIFQELKDSLDLTKKDELEMEYWDIKFHKELTMNVILGYPVPIGLAHNIMSLPNSCQSKRQLSKLIDSRTEVSFNKKKELISDGSSNKSFKE